MYRLYIGNLSTETTEDRLRAAIDLSVEDGGDVRVSLALDRLTGRSRGFAYIDFTSRVHARAAIVSLTSGELDGRALCVNEVHSGAEDDFFARPELN